MGRTFFAIVFSCTCFQSAAAIWEIDLGGVQAAGLLGGNVIDSLPNSFASGKEVSFNEVPGILYDDAANALELHVGWGIHETVQGAELHGLYHSSGLYGPAPINGNAPGALYSFDITSGYTSVNGPDGKSGFVHARVLLADIGSYTVAQQEADLLQSRWYFMVNSTTYESGEIRGQLLTAIPEPKSYAVVTGLALLMAFIGRRKLLEKIH